MKKVVLSFICFLTACHSIFGYDTEFKNPIFNQPLEPLPKDSGYVYLTPDSIDIREPNDKNTTYKRGKCQLVENQENYIKLYCRVRWPRDEEILKISEYVIKTNNDPDLIKLAEQDLHYYSGDYYENEYYTYTIQDSFLDNCVNIEENIYDIEEGYIRKVSSAHFCTPPLKISY